MTTVGLGIICHQRPAELEDALASASADRWDEIVVLDMASDPPLPPRRDAVVLRSDDNVGVTAGRNRLLGAVSCDVVVFLDDDAVLTGEVVDALRRRFDGDDRLAVVAFAVRRRDGSMASSEYPFRGRPDDRAAARPCAYFVGCAYAARRRAVEAVGGYDETFFYSTEEVDLSLRLIGDGWRLLYDPGLTVEHRPSPRGRSVAPHVPALRLRNRLVVARRHLPAAAGVVHVAAWGLRTFREAAAAGGLRPWSAAWRQGLSAPVERRPLGWSEVLRVHRLGGRALW